MEECKGFTEALLAGSIKGLGHAYRFTTFPLIKAENVAEHSFWASIYALAIWHKIRAMYPGWFADLVSKERLMEMALTHDLEERVSGDIVKNFKDSDPSLRKLLDQHALEGSVVMFRREGYPEEFIQATLSHRAWHVEAGITTKTHDLEAKIVSLADTMCVASKQLGESEMGNANARNLLLKIFVPEMELQQQRFMALYRNAENRKTIGEEEKIDLVEMCIAFFYGDMGCILEDRLMNPETADHYLGMWRKKG